VAGRWSDNIVLGQRNSTRHNISIQPRTCFIDKSHVATVCLSRCVEHSEHTSSNRPRHS
jgi:hypothetical protein